VLGHGDEKDIRFDKPRQVGYFAEKGIQIKDVSLGEYHTVALSEDGDVYTWGYGGKQGMFNWMYSQEVGALGHGDKQPTFVPKKVSYF
jgi:alpha-tubulin suppressor-like RCC1 family protein